ncbi:MAG: nucleoside diphosphate kinase regulator [Methylophilaceae bacterium]|jgi:regulator of nucleoside diphosphate kinase|uniref:nucleoside diphosphate kinase regulator n=1 Tax=Methylobacillus sp. MM3 TaxID=1848039 RepID=UPI001F0B020B|nr:nucleoside diphosphate kinase regulator [Methylobacillus sp. MM3]
MQLMTTTNTQYLSALELRKPMDAEALIVSMPDYVRLREIARDLELGDELDRAIVVPADRMPVNVVTMHSRLIYIDESTDTRREVELVYPDEANPPAGKISVLAPVGSALLGLSVGQSIDWVFPEGKSHRLRVERIVFHPRQRSEDG